MMNIFDFLNYKEYLRSRINSMPKRGHGVRLAIAGAARCKTGYVSQVLNGKADFSLEQSFRLNKFFEHDPEESKYFILLVNYSRAGSKDLKDFFRSQIAEYQNKSLQLKNRLNVKNTISEADMGRYFSSVENSLVHILLTIPGFQTSHAIQEKLKLPAQRLKSILNFLVEIGLAKEERGVFTCTEGRLHLADDSPLILVKHAQWRLQAIKACQNPAPADLHYSSIISVSRDDLIKIKQSLIQEINRNKTVIKDSPPEIMASFCLDFYELN